MSPVSPAIKPERMGVSVIIPAYNYAGYLPAAVDSVLRQEHSNYEIIVVDDGSTDNTSEVVKQYGDRVRYIYQKNAGLPAARNAGIRASKFGYIGLLDADDLWLPGFLRCAMNVFAQLPPEFGIVACHGIYIDGNGVGMSTKQLDADMPEEITCRDIILKTRFSPSAVVAKKSAFEEAGFFDETLRSSEDRDMWIRIAARYRVRLLRDSLALIRRHPGNMSKHADRMKANVRKVINKAYEQGLASRTNIGFWLRVLSFHYFQNAWRYRDEGRRSMACREMLLSLLLWPCFVKSRLLNEPCFFRSRALVRFAWEALAR